MFKEKKKRKRKRKKKKEKEKEKKIILETRSSLLMIYILADAS